jgi:hypothetical protein
MPGRPHPALVLWLIREREANTWADLAKYFRLAPGRKLRTTLYQSLVTLWQTQFIWIEQPGWPDPYSVMPTYQEFENSNFSLWITPHAREMLDAFTLSLTELSKSDPYKRIIVEPSQSLERADDASQYESDILVFMPFSEALQPVYDDHLKAVATKLGQSIKRGDDFFTTQEVIGDIWTALLETKLVIADCTGRNPNVFYEIGLAHAVGKRTVLITQNDDDVPFDLRHRRYIHYVFDPRGMKRFEDALERTIKSTLKLSSQP